MITILLLLMKLSAGTGSLNFADFAVRPCVACEKPDIDHEIPRGRLFEVTITVESNIKFKTDVFVLSSRCTAVIIGRDWIVSTAKYLQEHTEAEKIYVYSGYLIDVDFAEIDLDKRTIVRSLIHPKFSENENDYNIAVSLVDRTFEGPLAHVPDAPIKFIGETVGQHCNILGYNAKQAIMLKINLLSKDECIARIQILKMKTNLTGNSFCVTLQDIAEVPSSTNINGAPAVCKGEVKGLMLLDEHAAIDLHNPIPMLDVGAESFWLRSRILRLRSLNITSSGLATSPNFMSFSFLAMFYLLH